VIAKTVFVLCALTSIACAVLLVRGYMKSRVKLLLWSSFCFVGLALNNTMLVVDRVFFPAEDLSIARAIPGVAGLLVLLFGLVWDSE
jgi:hypothetical protein